MQKLQQSIAAKVAEVLTATGKTQEAFAEWLDVSRRIVGYWLKAERTPSLGSLAKMASFVGRDVAWFFQVENQQTLGTPSPSSATPLTPEPLEALELVRLALIQSSAGEPSAEPDASQLAALQAENAALKAELKKLRTSRGYGKTKVHVPPREAPPASDQRETGS